MGIVERVCDKLCRFMIFLGMQMKFLDTVLLGWKSKHNSIYPITSLTMSKRLIASIFSETGYRSLPA